jgi:hypothetical protein
VDPALASFIDFGGTQAARKLRQAALNRRYGRRTLRFNCFDVIIDVDAATVTLEDAIELDGLRAVIPLDDRLSPQQCCLRVPPALRRPTQPSAPLRDDRHPRRVMCGPRPRGRARAVFESETKCDIVRPHGTAAQPVMDDSGRRGEKGCT